MPTFAWLLLGVLAYALVTCVLGTLAARVRDDRARHDLVVEARELRRAYRRKGQRMAAGRRQEGT